MEKMDLLNPEDAAQGDQLADIMTDPAPSSEAGQTVLPTGPQCPQSLIAQAVQQNSWSYITQMGNQSCSAQQRDVILREILAHRQWQCGWCCVLHLVNLGVRSDLRGAAFLTAVQESQWQCARRLMALGVGREKRGAAIWLMCAQQELDTTAELIQLGLPREDREGALSKSAEQGHVTFLLQLARVCGDSEVRDFVAKEAVTQKQWQLVSDLVTVGLGATQLESVYQEAVACQQWDLALSLLHGGVRSSAALLDEIFMASKQTFLLDLFAAGTMGRELRSLMLLSAVKNGQWETFLSVKEQHGISDKDIVAATKVAVDSWQRDIFYNLVFLSDHSLRLFKQTCNKHAWRVGGNDCDIHYMVDCLEDHEEQDLALYLATVTEAWSEIPNVICSEFVTKKTRRFALKRLCAIGVDETELVFDEAAKKLLRTNESYRRELFLLAVRHKNFSSVADLYGDGVTMGDVRFALRLLLCTRLDPRAVKKLCEQLDGKNKIETFKFALRRAMKEAFEEKAVKEEQYEYFNFKFHNLFNLLRSASEHPWNKSVTFDFFCRIFDFAMKRSVTSHNADMCSVFILVCHLFAQSVPRKELDDEEDIVSNSFNSEEQDILFTKVRRVFRFAIKENKGRFVVDTLFYCYEHDSDHHPCLLKPAVEEIFKAGDWKLLETVAQKWSSQGPFYFRKEMIWCLTQCIIKKKTWEGCAPVLEGWLNSTGTSDSILLRINFMKVNEGKNLRSFVDWCCQNLCPRIAIVLGLYRKDFALLDKIMSEHVDCTPFAKKLLRESASSALELEDWETVVSILKVMTQEDFGSHRVNRCYSPQYQPLVALCEKEGLDRWAASIAFQIGDIRVLERVLANCSDKRIVDATVTQAACSNHWDMVETVLPLTSQDPSLLFLILKRALSGYYGSVELSKVLLERVDPLLEKSGESLLRNAVSICGVRPTKGKVSLLHTCVEVGLCSADLDVQSPSGSLHSWLSTIIFDQNLFCFKLLHRCGTFTNQTLHAVRTKRSQWYESGDASGIKKVLQCVCDAASNPLSLQDLCRRTVSRSISCRPGRQDRIQALPVPQPVKDFLRFSDLIQANLEDIEQSGVRASPNYSDNDQSEDLELFDSDSSDIESIDNTLAAYLIMFDVI